MTLKNSNSAMVVRLLGDAHAALSPGGVGGRLMARDSEARHDAAR
jgi:hypothetical protein